MPGPLPGLFLHQQITQALREAILSGELAEGTRLPSMEELARQWETSYFTIRQAMKPLVQEGLVEHRRRVGSVVKGRRPTLGRVGVYYGADILGLAETTFYRSLHARLRERLAERDVELIPFIDEREEAAQETPLPALVQAVEGRTIQALVVAMSSRSEVAWLREIPLAKAQIGSVEVPWAVRPDVAQQIGLALERLRGQGVRSVGLIANLPRDFDPVDREELPLVTQLRAAATTHGLETRPEWQLVPERILAPTEMEPYGYQAFHDLGRAMGEGMPEAMLSTSDVIGRGMLTAVLKLAIPVPERLRVVQWVNAGTGLFTPLPVDRVVLEEGRVADALLRQIDLQMAGQPVTPLSVETQYHPFP